MRDHIRSKREHAAPEAEDTRSLIRFWQAAHLQRHCAAEKTEQEQKAAKRKFSQEMGKEASV